MHSDSTHTHGSHSSSCVFWCFVCLKETTRVTHRYTNHDHTCRYRQEPCLPGKSHQFGVQKIQRVVTSTLSAETTSLGTTLDQLSWLRLFWSWIRDPRTDWKNATATLNKLPETYATTTFKEDDSVAATDCKSLFDLVTRTAPPSCQEFRTQLQARAISNQRLTGGRGQVAMGAHRGTTGRRINQNYATPFPPQYPQTWEIYTPWRSWDPQREGKQQN